MKPSTRISAVFTLLLIVCFAGSTLALRRIDQLRAGATLQEVLYIPSPGTVKRMSLGYTGLMADIYWTRVVQYFGRRHHAQSNEYKLLGPLLDIATELDPHLLVAYQFGSIFLSQQPPEGAGDPVKAVQLVERGIRYNPTEWRLYFNLGFIQYSELRDYKAAERTFERGSRVPGAHPSLKILAASMARHAGELEVSRYLWAQIYETTQDKMVRDNAIQHLQALTVDEDVTRLEAALQAYRRAFGQYPRSWQQLVAGGWRGPLIDPLGYAYLLMPDGSVQVQHPKDLPFITKGLPPGWKSRYSDPFIHPPSMKPAPLVN